MDLEEQQYISRLVLSYIEGKLGKEEQKELEAWRFASESHEQLFRRMLSASHLEKSMSRHVKSKSVKRAEWEIIRHRTIGLKQRRIHWYPYAAMIALPLLIAGLVFYLHKPLADRDLQQPKSVVSIVIDSAHTILELADGTYVDLENSDNQNKKESDEYIVVNDSLKYYNTDKSKEEEFHTLRVPRGGEYTLILADGTTVYMNAASYLKYPVCFTGDNRTVELEGEAYFEVKKDTVHPFIIEAAGIQVKVLGTSFGIRAYTESRQVFTTLVSGRVRVHAAGQEVDLLPCRQAIFDKELTTLSTRAVDTELFVSWKDGYYKFERSTLDEIMATVALWYDLKVVYHAPETKDIQFTGRLKRYDHVSALLKKIEQSGVVRFEIKGKEVVVQRK